MRQQDSINRATIYTPFLECPNANGSALKILKFLMETDPLLFFKPPFPSSVDRDT